MFCLFQTPDLDLFESSCCMRRGYLTERLGCGHYGPAAGIEGKGKTAERKTGSAMGIAVPTAREAVEAWLLNAGLDHHLVAQP